MVEILDPGSQTSCEPCSMIDEEMDSPDPDPKMMSSNVDFDRERFSSKMHDSLVSESLEQISAENGVVNVAGNCEGEDNVEDGKSLSNNNFAIKDENRQKVIASGNNLENGLLPFSLEMKENEKRMSDQSSLVCSSLLHFEGQSQLEKGKQQKAHLVSMSKKKEKIKFSPSTTWSKLRHFVDKEINGLSQGRITVSKSPLSTNGESGNNYNDNNNDETTRSKDWHFSERDAESREREVLESNMENDCIESGHLGNDTSSKMDWLSLASSLKLSATKSLETDLNTSHPRANSIQLSELDSKGEKVENKSERENLLPRDASQPEAINIYFESRCQKSSNRSFNYDVEDGKRRRGRSTTNIQSCAPSDVLEKDLESSSNKMENEIEEKNEQQLRQHSMCTQVKTENNFPSSKSNINNNSDSPTAALQHFSSEVNLSQIDEHGRMITTNLFLLAPKKEEPLDAEMGSYFFDGELKFMIEEAENKFQPKEENWSDKEIEIVGEKFVPQQRYFFPHGSFFLPRTFSCCYPRLSYSNLLPCMCSNVTQIPRHAGVTRLKKCYVRMEDAKAVCDAFIAATKSVRKKRRTMTGKRKGKLIGPTYNESLCEINNPKRRREDEGEKMMRSKSCESEERTKATSYNKKRMSVISKSAARFKPTVRTKFSSSEDSSSNNDVSSACGNDLKLTIKINKQWKLHSA